MFMCLTRFARLWQELSEPFGRDEVKTRKGGGGRELSYITARQAMNRLDSVLGPENWWDDYTVVGDVLYCRLSVRLPDGQVVTKLGAGGFKTMLEKNRDGSQVIDEENTDKTGESDSFKRAAVKFGIGRELYGDGNVDYSVAIRAQTPPDVWPDWLYWAADRMKRRPENLRRELFSVCVTQGWTTNDLPPGDWDDLFSVIWAAPEKRNILKAEASRLAKAGKVAA
jgi:Rad52/22 family double-strand break repair protein